MYEERNPKTQILTKTKEQGKKLQKKERKIFGSPTENSWPSSQPSIAVTPPSLTAVTSTIFGVPSIARSD